MKKLALICTLISATYAHSLNEIYERLSGFGSVMAAKYQADAAMQQAKSAQGSYYPFIDLSAGAVFNQKGVDLFAPKRAQKASISISYLLFDKLRDAGVAAAKNSSELANLKAKSSLLDAKLSAAKSYYQRLAISKAKDAASAQCAALNQASKDVAKLAKAGLKELDEAQMIQAAACECEAKVAKLAASAAMLDASLSALAGTSVKANGLSETGESLGDELESKSSQALDDAQPNANLEILSAQIASKLADDKLSAAKAKFMPQVFIKDEYSFTKSRLRYDSFGPLKSVIKANSQESANANSLSLGFKINLFAGSSDKHALEAAKLNALAAASMINAAKAKNAAELEANSAKISANSKALIAAKASFEAAKAASASIESKYSAGLANYLDYLKAVAAKANASALIAQQQAELAIAKAERRYLLGDLND